MIWMLIVTALSTALSIALLIYASLKTKQARVYHKLVQQVIYHSDMAHDSAKRLLAELAKEAEILQAMKIQGLCNSCKNELEAKLWS